MRLVFIHGPAASGKLTVARELAAKGAFAYPALPAARVAVDSGTMHPAEAAERIRAALGLG